MIVNMDMNCLKILPHTLLRCQAILLTAMVVWSDTLVRHDSVSMESRYETVRRVLREKDITVYDSDRFEESWTDIAKMLNVSVEPRLNSNQSDRDYQKIVSYSDLTSDEFKTWHRAYNHFDYLLYEEFCK
jgi:hypothetical protein